MQIQSCIVFVYHMFHMLCFRESVAGLRTFLLEQTAAGGDRQVLAYVTDLLNKQVGFLLNERYVNIPAQVINPPLHIYTLIVNC